MTKDKQTHRSRFHKAKDDAQFAQQATSTPQTASEAYKLAFQDTDFLLREDLRPVRFQLELLKPELLLDVLVFLTAVYGGYFGAAQGVILIALLAIFFDDQLQRLNALKNVLAALVNGVGSLLFAIFAAVAWLPAALLAAGSVLGGQIGARYGRRLPPELLRLVIVVVGIAVSVKLFLDW